MTDHKLAIEEKLGAWLRRYSPPALTDFLMFGAKMAWATIFAGILLLAIIITRYIYPDEAWLSRYDFLTLFALSCQVLMIVFKLESWSEVKVIFLFHLSGTVMEVFKLAKGSWDYPDTGLFEIAGVPLFSGFMYASVGSFMVRAIRGFDMKFTPFIKPAYAYFLAFLIYLNFFTHHYIVDLRWVLIGATVLCFGRTQVYFTPLEKTYRMSLVLAAFLSSLFLYLAENIGTLTATWTYAGSSGVDFTHPAKITSWYLLLYLSFMQVIWAHISAVSVNQTEPQPE
uniref:DUF817 domain-containing protein n=1 Tax=Thaumasiovibrio occultus TaxID=1891184 RepID=UPI00131B0B58|nr:DUF817 domain-containing protein [Thaumasiovibrio occultus]